MSGGIEWYIWVVTGGNDHGKKKWANQTPPEHTASH